MEHILGTGAEQQKLRLLQLIANDTPSAAVDTEDWFCVLLLRLPELPIPGDAPGALGQYEPLMEDIINALSIPGLTKDNSCNAVQAYEKYASMPEKVAVIGGSETGTEVGIFLAEQGHKAHVLTRQGMLCPETPHSHYVIMIMDYFKANPNFAYTTFVKEYLGFENGKLRYLDKNGTVSEIEADYVVVCAGSRPMQQEAMAFHGCADRVHYIGDCVKQGNVHEATLAAWRTANQI